MAGEWRETTVGALCDAGVAELRTGPFGSQLHAYDYVSDGIPVVPTEAIRARRINHSVLPNISPAKAEALARHRLKRRDILFARRGVQATGHIGFVREEEEGFICGTGAIRLRIDSAIGEVDADYLSHVLADSASISWFKFHAIGATMPNLNEGIVRAFPLALPPLPEQRAIAHILGTLDDKIELNRRRNATLEAMARALFRSWFVDFDPVRAKSQGRDPGQTFPSLPAHFHDLFPSQLVETEHGEIPEGWRNWCLRDIARLHRETLTPSSAPQRVFEHYSIPAYDRGQNPALDRGEMTKSNKTLVPEGAVLLSKLNPDINRVWLPDPPGEAPQIASTELLCLTPVRPAGRSLLYCLFTDAIFRLELEAMVTGTSKSHQRVPPRALMATDVLVGTETVFEAFENTVAPLLARTITARIESRTLAALRDALLPKLISGELRVNDAEKFVERVS